MILSCSNEYQITKFLLNERADLSVTFSACYKIAGGALYELSLYSKKMEKRYAL